LTTSYLHLPHHRITSVDPYGQASVGMHPYLNLEVRQPLPNIAFIPARIEALADFRNLLEQGYVPVFGAGEDPLLLSAAYRSFRGGFSVNSRLPVPGWVLKNCQTDHTSSTRGSGPLDLDALRAPVGCTEGSPGPQP
jgi:hypothetical protein